MVKNIAENFNRLSRAHQRHRQTTDDRQTTDWSAIAYSEREREFTSAKNDTASITKLDIEMFHDESWKPVYFGVRKIKGLGHIAGVGLCTLLSAGFF